jgi:hypothetical protein
LGHFDVREKPELEVPSFPLMIHCDSTILKAGFLKIVHGGSALAGSARTDD